MRQENKRARRGWKGAGHAECSASRAQKRVKSALCRASLIGPAGDRALLYRGGTVKSVSPLFVAVFAVWIGIGSFASRRERQRLSGPSAARAEDLAGIEELHRQDVAATLSGDPAALANLFTSDAVLLEPGSPAVIGKSAILAENGREKASHPGFREWSYTPEIQDIQIVDDWAIEWGDFDAIYCESPGSEVKRFRGESLRVLKRQRDGSWKFARVMWNVAGGD
jgi:uncharacterized protein (TIGR02246 family)